MPKSSTSSVPEVAKTAPSPEDYFNIRSCTEYEGFMTATEGWTDRAVADQTMDGSIA